MAVSKSKIGIYSIAGILAAVIIVSSFLIAGIQFPTANIANQNKVGTLVVSLKDAPADIEKLMLTVSAIYIQDPTADDENTWKLLPFTDGDDDGEPDQEITFDLLEYEELSLKVAEVELNAGTYHKVRLQIIEALAIYDNGDEVELKVPPRHIDIIVDLEIEAGKVTELIIDIEPDGIEINKNNVFRPIIKTTIKSPSTESTEETQEATEETTNSPSPSPSEQPTESAAPTIT